MKVETIYERNPNVLKGKINSFILGKSVVDIKLVIDSDGWYTALIMYK